MSLILYLVLLACTGLIAGGAARLVLPGPDPMTVFETLVLGLAGNFVAGVIVWALWGHGIPGIVLSTACSTVILYLIRRSRGGGLTRPGT
jgi:uncharacterized membrane protein YeaQ/YmgE (transglycosylase-associated protein family)